LGEVAAENVVVTTETFPVHSLVKHGICRFLAEFNDFWTQFENSAVFLFGDAGK